MELQPRSNKTRVLAILLVIIGGIIFLSSVISTIRISEYYIGKIYSSAFSYFIAIIFGRVGWGIHFGITLLLIGIYLLQQRNRPVTSGEETNRLDGFQQKEKRNEMSVMEWFGTLILLAIPLVNLILLFVWGFGANSPKKNFSRAILLYYIVVAIIALIVVAIANSSMYF